MAGFGSDFHIRVKQDDLRQTGGDVQTNLKTFQTQWSDLIDLVKNTQHYWIGKGAETKRKELITLNKDVERMIERLGEYQVDLMEIAGIYDKAESDNAELSESLPADVII